MCVSRNSEFCKSVHNLLALPRSCTTLCHCASILVRAVARAALAEPEEVAAFSTIERAFDTASGVNSGDTLAMVALPCTPDCVRAERRASRFSAGLETLRTLRAGPAGVVVPKVASVGARAMCAYGPGIPRLTGAGFGGAFAMCMFGSPKPAALQLAAGG